MTLLIGKAAAPKAEQGPVKDAVEELVRDGAERMQAIKQVARRRGLSKREVYEQLLDER
jgi:16S rRNA C1402 (ribose-2'-O) methylase RsmI